MLAANQAYLVSIGVRKENQQSCLEAMEKYGDNQWWLSEDPKERAYYQFNEPLLLLPSVPQLREDLGQLVNRDVYSHDLVSSKFKQEVERAWKYGVGATSDKERRERFEESVQELRDKGKEVQIFELPNQDCN